MAKKEAATVSSTPVPRYSLVWLGILVGMGFYFIDALVDTVLFSEGTLRDQLLHPSRPELWMQTSILVLAVAFAIYTQHLLRREHESRERAKTTERFLNSIVDNIPDMIFIKDAEELRFVRVNRTGEKLLGLTTKELIGKNDYNFFPKSQADHFTRKDREVLESGIKANIQEEQIDTATHGKRWLHTKKVPILDDKGQPAYLLGISEDITESRQAEIDQKKTEIRFQTLFDFAADLIFVIDPEGRILQTNRYACDHSGYEEHEIVGNSIKEFFTRDSQHTCDCNFPGLRERGYNRADIEFVCKDGRITQMECVASGIPDETGNFTSFLIIQRDVTDKNRANKDRNRYLWEMAHVMRLSTMGEMASGMAHELNQPLTALTSYCAAALKLAQEIPSLPDGYIDLLQNASGQAQRAGEVIRYLREFVGKGKHDKTCIVMNDVVQGVIDFISWELRDHDIQITFLPGPPAARVLVDKVQIEQVLINLIRNSMESIREAGIANGQVDIKTRLAAGGAVEVTVADNGPGIDPMIADSLFEPYQTSKEAGMGMGLSISRSIIEAHDGKLWFDGQRQQGAAFSMNLPECG